MQEHEQWFLIAKEDLHVAKILLKYERFSAVTYHSQQAAEKAFKGYLVFKNQEVLKTHDLIKLVGLCVKFDRTFEVFLDIVECLNPFSTKFRYPTEYDIPDLEDAALAVKHAQSIMRFVLKKILEPVTGQIDIFKEVDE